MELKLSPEVEEVIRSRVASGRYPDAETMVEQAVMSAVMVETEDAEWHREAVREGLESGEAVEVDLDDWRARLKAGLPWRS